MKRALFLTILSCLLFVAPIVRTQADQVDDYIKSEMKKRQIPGVEDRGFNKKSTPPLPETAW